MKICLATVLLVSLWQNGAAASLRSAPAKAPEANALKSSAKDAPKATADQKAQAQAEQVADTIAKALNLKTSVADASASTKKTVEAGTAQPVQHKKVDVGFQDFEKNLTEEISAKLVKTATGKAWNDDLRSRLTKNVTGAMKQTLTDLMKPLKQSIGKTWMALPQDAQKDEYVDTLKNSFLPVFASSLKTVTGHLELSLKRVEGYSQQKTPLSADELLQKSEFTIGDSMFTEHCYELDDKKSLQSTKNHANATDLKADKKKFCIQSVLGALAHRLNDTQGLISMSMRFEAGAMSLAQKKKKGLAH